MSDRIEKSFATVMKIDGEEVDRIVENISVEIADNQTDMIIETINNEFGKTTFREITIDRRRVERALLNATPCQPEVLSEDMHPHCGTCHDVIKTEYRFCPTCGRKIKWGVRNSIAKPLNP